MHNVDLDNKNEGYVAALTGSPSHWLAQPSGLLSTTTPVSFLRTAYYTARLLSEMDPNKLALTVTDLSRTVLLE